MRVWQTFLQSKEWGKRPSEIVGVNGEYESYCFDQAVWHFGQGVQQRLEEARNSGSKNESQAFKESRVQNTFRQLMGLAPKFRSL